MFYFDHICWVLHHRVVCKSCKKTCASIDPRHLANLPTRVAERFPFMTTASGPGIHISMIHQFTSLMTKGVIFGSYVKMINELQKIRYDREQISYYDSVYSSLVRAEEEELILEAPVVKAFSPFDSPGEFGGIKLTRNLLKA